MPDAAAPIEIMDDRQRLCRAGGNPEAIFPELGGNVRGRAYATATAGKCLRYPSDDDDENEDNEYEDKDRNKREWVHGSTVAYRFGSGSSSRTLGAAVVEPGSV